MKEYIKPNIYSILVESNSILSNSTYSIRTEKYQQEWR